MSGRPFMIAVALFASAGTGMAAVVDFSAWTNSTRINFNTTSTGANISSDQTNFPVLVRLDANNFIFTQADPTGKDIRFADPDRNSLSYEIDRWDAALKKAEIWVLVPQIDANSDRDYIDMYWGNGAATALSSGSAVFTSGTNWMGVWHLDEDGNTTAAGYGDATANSYTGTGTGLSGSSDVSGQMGLGQQFDGATTYITLTGTYPITTAARTMSLWAKATSPITGNQVIAAYGSYPGAGNQVFGLSEWSTPKWGSWTDGASNPSGTTPPDQGWHHLVASYDGATVRFYQDGALAGSGALTLNTTSGNFVVGARMNDKTLKWTGVVDELRMSSVQRSADWIKLEYENQKTGSRFLAYPNTLLSTFSYSSKVYINTTASGANITSNQSDFPLLVRLTNGNFNFAQAKSDGGDLRFADSTGALLPYEIERFDATNRLAEIWVSIPTVYAGNNTQWFRMYWGKATATSLSSSAAVFQTADNFAGEWHLSEASGSASDASSNGNNGAFNGNVPNQQNGIIGKAHLFDGNGDYINAGTNGSYDLSANDRVTVSAWVNRSGAAASGPEEGIATKYHWTDNNRSFGIWYTSATAFKFAVSTNGTAETIVSSGSAATNGAWYHVVGVADGAKARIYVNGVEAANTAFSGNINYSSGSTFRIGEVDDGGGGSQQYFNGYIDEVSVSNVVRSADWIKLSYETQKAAATAVSIGARTADFTNSVRFNFNTTATGANVSGSDVTNIPILVRLSSSNFDFSKTTDTGTDIKFIDKDGTNLYHEVVEWDKANQSGKVWVKVPQVDKNSTSDFITLYYGCAACTGNPYAVDDSVWNGFKGVFHLNAPEDKAYDATALANHGTYFKDQANITGLTGKNAPFFDGSTDYIDVPNETNYDIFTNISAWAWIKVSSLTKGWQTILSKGDNSWRLSRYSSTNNIGFSCNQGGAHDLQGAVNVNDGAWHLVVGTYDGANMKLYVDGVQDGSNSALTGSVDNSAYDVMIGENAQQVGRQWNGGIGEVRIGNAANVLNADFIKLSYENQKAASTLFSATTITTASFQKTKVFKLNTTASGANVAGDVYNFPLLLRITGNAVGTATPITDLTQSAGQDIRFLDGDGVTWLDYQIERWDPSVDSAEVWVKVPRVYGNSASNTITMYYQQAAAFSGNMADGQCASCVFSPSNGFAAVWHLNQAGNTTAANYADATGNGSNGTGVAMVAATKVSALSAQGQTFNGSTQYINVPASGTAVAINNKSFTLSGWFNRTAAGTPEYAISQGTAATDNGLHFGFRNTNNLTIAFWADDLNSTGTYAATGTWQYLTGTFDLGTKSQKIYYNGNLENSRTASGNYAGTGDMHLAQNIWGGTDWFPGTLDEFNVSTVARDSNWIKLSYQSQRRDATPLFNPSPADFTSSKKYAFNTTRTGANVMNDVANYPLLVRITGSTIVDAVQNNAPDIRFLDGDGKTWLNYQVERWDKTLDSAEVWVLVPQVDGNSDHDFITLYYDDVTNGAVTDGQCAACVFSSGDDFVGAWHLNTSGTGARPNAVSGGNSATPVNYDNDEFTGGVIAGADNLDGAATGDYLDLGTGYADFTAGLTYSVWAYPTAANNYSRFLDLGTGGPGDNILFFREGTGTELSGMLANNTTTGTRITTASTPLSLNTWQYLTMTADASGFIRIYKNGSLIQSGASGLSLRNISRTQNYLGKSNWGSDAYYAGRFDEPELSRVVRDSNWIKLNYQTQRWGSGNVFWNNRVGPNNKVALTATAVAPGNISLSWNTPVSDSSNADSVGLWVKYTAFPDSANAPAASAGSATHVVNLVKTDSAYTYPATYPGTYYFALAVRNSSGKWSPFTSSSSDTANLGSVLFPDTVYVDSAIGNDANTCAQARNPATPKLTIGSAVTNCTASDTLVVRVMPGTYANDNSFTKNTADIKTHIVSFDNNSRATLNGTGSVAENGRTWNYTVAVNANITLRQMDVRAAANGHVGVFIRNNADSVTLDGNRIYSSGANVYDTAISICNSGSDYLLIMNNVIYQPTVYGIEIHSDDNTNIVNNVFYGLGGSSKGIYMNLNAANEKFTISNNIFYNWNYGIHTTDANSEIGTVSNNLFFLVTTNQEVVGETDAAKLLKDPLFANTTLGNPNAFKLLPGSPAIDAGTATISTGAGSYSSVSALDQFGSARTIGSAPDIGAYEGTGYTPNPTGEFDSLITTSTATTVTVYNSKWKVVFDKAKGGGISEFYDQTAPASNLLAAGTVLFDDKVGATSASSQSSIAPTIVEQSLSRVVVRQRFAYSASLDVNFYYTLYPSGHIYIQAEYANLFAGALAPGSVDYTLKVNSAVTAFNSKAKDGFAYLTTATRDAALSVIRPLDDGSQSAETWTGSAASGASGNVVFNTAALASMPRYYKRYHHFLIYIGDANLDFAKASVINADVSNPSPLTATSGSLIHERSWQDLLGGHWTFDEGAGSVARDKSVNYANNGNITGAKYVSGKINAALTFTSSDVVVVGDADVLEASGFRTYMLWVKPNFASGSMGSDAYLISKGQNSTDGWSLRRITSANTLRFRMGAATVDSPALTDGVWTHIAVVADGDGILRMYINGVLQAVSSTLVSPVVNAGTLRIGENDAGTAANRFVGDIDDVRIYLTNISIADIQSICNRGFSQRYGNYRLRADNNNRMVVLINGGAAQTRVQPAFQVDNWFGTATPRYVYLNGTRLAPNTDFSAAIVTAAGPEGNGSQFGSRLMLQLNKFLTDADQTLFIDDDDSTGYMGSASQMKSLTMSSVAGDKLAIKNFPDTVFNGAASGQWYLELDLNGWTSWNSTRVVDTGFGEFNVWKDAAINPNVAISSSTNQAGIDANSGRSLSHIKFDNTTTTTFSGGSGYLAPANITYTLTDSSATRLSLVLANMSMQGPDGTFTLSKRFTVYPTGRIFASYVVSSLTFNSDDFSFDIQSRYNSGVSYAWSNGYAASNARFGMMGGDLNFHSIAGGLLSVKNNTNVYATAAGMVSGAFSNLNGNTGGADYRRARLAMNTSLCTSANSTPIPITINYVLDISKNFTDSATADSLIKDVQTPGVITAITGTRTTNDALDFNADNFAEGDGAYTYAAAGNIAHFKFVNTVTTFNPAFRINTWTAGTVPEFVEVDNQVLNRGYQYNVYLNTAGAGGGELVLQFNKTLPPGNHVFYISHKTGLAVTLRSFQAKGGDGVDTLTWTTESEFENLGYNVYRRLSASQIDNAFADGSQVAGAGDSTLDTIPSHRLTADELAALGYVRINPKLIPGAKGGSAATTQAYGFIDRTAAYGVAYDYLLESVDFNGNHEQFGPRTARPANPLTTELYSNYPNPFNPITTLRFSLKDKVKVSLVIYDSKGRLVRTLVRPEKTMLPGKYRLIWDARDEGGMEAPSGQYFYRFTAARYVKTRKMMLIK